MIYYNIFVYSSHWNLAVELNLTYRQEHA